MKKFSYTIITVAIVMSFTGCGGGGGGSGTTDGTSGSGSSPGGTTTTLVKAQSNEDALNPPLLPGATAVPVDQIANN